MAIFRRYQTVNDLLKRQIAEAEALEQHQKEVMLKPIRAIASELDRTLRDLPKDSPAINHYGAIALQINNLFSALDPESQLSSLPYIAGYTEALEEAARLGAESFPFINLQVLSQTRSESVEKIRAVNNEAKLKVFESLQVSLALGEGAFDTAKRLEETGIRNTYWKYERIARTSTTDLINSAHLTTYEAIAEQNPDTKWQKEYVAVGDIRTSDICLKSDGEIRDFDKTFSNGVLRPPAHPNCRSRITLVAKEKKPAKIQSVSSKGKTTKTKAIKDLKALGADLKAPVFVHDLMVNDTLKKGYELAQRLAPDLLSAFNAAKELAILPSGSNKAKEKEEEFLKFRQKIFDAGLNTDPKIPLIAAKAAKLSDKGAEAAKLVEGYLRTADFGTSLPEKIKFVWGKRKGESEYDPNEEKLTLTPTAKDSNIVLGNSLIHELTHVINFGSFQRRIAIQYGKQMTPGSPMLVNDPTLLEVRESPPNLTLTNPEGDDVRFNATLGYRKYASRAYVAEGTRDLIMETEILSSASELLSDPLVFIQYLTKHQNELYLFLGVLNVDL